MKRCLMLFIAVLFTPAVLAAQDNMPSTQQNPNEHLGYYVEGTVGTGAYYAGIFTSENNAANAGAHGVGLSAAVGYNFTHVVALEGGLIWWHIASNNGVIDESVAGNVYAPYVTARFNVHLGQRFALIFKTGLMAAIATAKSTSGGTTDSGGAGIILPFIGFGGSYALNQHLSLTAQYQGAIYGIVGAGLLSGGLTYHFN